MTDEEKYIAWRNANSIIDRHNVTDTSIGHKHIHWNNGVDRHKAYLDGLTEGRKETAEKISEVEKENAELKELVDKQTSELMTRFFKIKRLNEKISELEKENAEMKAQNEKMKNFYNCAHSSRALCPNGHKCAGCIDWELDE